MLKQDERKKTVRIETMEYYRFTKDFQNAGFFETEQHKRFFRQIKTDIRKGSLITVSGMIGSGKTVSLRRLRELLSKEGKILVCRSLFVEKQKVQLSTLITALFCDLHGTDKFLRQCGEHRERALVELIRQQRKPVVLFVDEAHDLQMQTIREIKRILEVANDSGAKLSVILSGHPKLTNDMKRMTMQEVGTRAVTHSLDGAIDNRRQYIEWLLTECTEEGVSPQDIIDPAAVDLLAEKLVTPLQVEYHLSAAFDAGHAVNEKPISTEIIFTVLSKAIDNLEAKLTRLGYDHKSIAGLLNVSPGEARQFMSGQLDTSRSSELHQELLVVGLPV